MNDGQEEPQCPSDGAVDLNPDGRPESPQAGCRLAFSTALISDGPIRFAAAKRDAARRRAHRDGAAGLRADLVVHLRLTSGNCNVTTKAYERPFWCVAQVAL